MHPHEIHHIKAYIVFFLFSAFVIGILAYLYIPGGIEKNLGASVLQETPVPDDTTPDVLWQPAEADAAVSAASKAEASERRMRMVKVLLRSQKELQTLEAARSASAQWLDPTLEEKITTVRAKIAALEILITEVQ